MTLRSLDNAAQVPTPAGWTPNAETLSPEAVEVANEANVADVANDTSDVDDAQQRVAARKWVGEPQPELEGTKETRIQAMGRELSALGLELTGLTGAMRRATDALDKALGRGEKASAKPSVRRKGKRWKEKAQRHSGSSPFRAKIEPKVMRATVDPEALVAVTHRMDRLLSRLPEWAIQNSVGSWERDLPEVDPRKAIPPLKSLLASSMEILGRLSEVRGQLRQDIATLENPDYVGLAKNGHTVFHAVGVYFSLPNSLDLSTLEGNAIPKPIFRENDDLFALGEEVDQTFDLAKDTIEVLMRAIERIERFAPWEMFAPALLGAGLAEALFTGCSTAVADKIERVIEEIMEKTPLPGWAIASVLILERFTTRYLADLEPPGLTEDQAMDPEKFSAWAAENQDFLAEIEARVPSILEECVKLTEMYSHDADALLAALDAKVEDGAVLGPGLRIRFNDGLNIELLTD